MASRLSHIAKALAVTLLTALMAACSSSRHVPEGQKLLNSVKINLQDKPSLSGPALSNYLRQQPNHKVLGFLKLQLAIYNMSGSDTTKWYNRWARNLGQEPVIYDPDLTEQSRRQLNLALINRGYNSATVSVDSVVNDKKKRVDLTYNITAGRPHLIETVTYQFDDPDIGEVIMSDSAKFTIKRGQPLNRDVLESERMAITERLRNKGYYAFGKEFITYIADTLPGSDNVDLTMRVHLPESAPGDTLPAHRRYIVARVTYLIEPPADTDSHERRDTVRKDDISIVYFADHYLRPSVLAEKCFIKPGRPYSISDVNRTYEALTQLGIVKFVNISITPASTLGDVEALDAVITIQRTRKQSVSLEVEGTNSEGDLGFGVGVSYQHRNLAHGSELLTAKIKASYESLSGNLDGFINNRFTEYSGETGITIPKFEMPFLSKSFKQRVRASTEFALSFNYQERPEYTRIIAGAAWKYRWNNPTNTWRHTFDLVDINMVNLPKSTIDFITTVAPTNPLLRYSYEDHLIMRMGYTFYRTNHRTQNTFSRLTPAPFQQNIWTLRASAESAGNLLYAISSLAGQRRHEGAYKIFGVQYAQYVKGEFDFSYLYNFNSRNGLALHIGLGVGVPYGNSSMIPFEKRFYAGGANSVRGWGVRTLGPGSYDARNSVTDFINQCGDIVLNLNAEYRAKLFWVVEGALFVDAGNIWTIRDYPNQPGGEFKFNRFYKEIALAYGCGVRLDFTYFLLRFDLGMKAHNPAANQEPWPLLHPHWSRDHTFHLSIGYPF